MSSKGWLAAAIVGAWTVGATMVGRADDEDAPHVVIDAATLEAPLPRSMPKPDGGKQAMAIDWPSVLDLCKASNLEIALAAEKVNEAQLTISLARAQWVPSLKAGTDWWHHEGRIQDFDGRVFDSSTSALFAGPRLSATLDPQKVCVDVLRAKQQVFARSGELDRVSRSTRQEASLAYIDLVTAQAGAAISIETSELIGKLVTRSQQLEKQKSLPLVDVVRNQTQQQSQRQFLNNARQLQLAASARLVELLNLEPGTRLYAADDKLAPVTLVDENQTEEELLQIAHKNGPGLAEIIALLSSLDQQQKQLQRIRFLPSVTADVGQGTFGGGPGGEYANFDSRTDLGLRVYWDITKIVGTAGTRGLFDSKRRQANLQHQQILAKLATGIVVSRDTAHKAKERIKLAEKEVDLAIQSYELSKARLDVVETQSPEVLQAIEALAVARANYLHAVIEYNKAQVRLQYLIGFGCESEGVSREPPPAPPPVKTRRASHHKGAK